MRLNIFIILLWISIVSILFLFINNLYAFNLVTAKEAYDNLPTNKWYEALDRISAKMFEEAQAALAAAESGEGA